MTELQLRRLLGPAPQRETAPELLGPAPQQEAAPELLGPAPPQEAAPELLGPPPEDVTNITPEIEEGRDSRTHARR